MQLSVADLERCLKLEAPRAYRDFVERADPALLHASDASPASICATNLEARSYFPAECCAGRLMLADNGSGDFFFIHCDDHDSVVYLLSHEDHGTETLEHSITDVLNALAGQQTPVDAPYGTAMVYRSDVWPHSVIAPIQASELAQAIEGIRDAHVTDQITMMNPLTQEVMVFDMPAICLATPAGELLLQLSQGRLMVDHGWSEHLDRIALIAGKLDARLSYTEGDPDDAEH